MFILFNLYLNLHFINTRKLLLLTQRKDKKERKEEKRHKPLSSVDTEMSVDMQVIYSDSSKTELIAEV